ncbi:MAG: hypothetical protein ACK44W_09640 [Planctomycetota bacterium]
MDPTWAERWKRLSEANARTHAERLRRLTMEESLQEFEALCREVYRWFDDPPFPKEHPVGLVKYWKSR